MAYEIKALLIALADVACRTNARDVYRLIQKMANAEGLVIKSYNEAKAELEKEDSDKLIRSVLYQIKTSKTLDEAINFLEVVAGEENVALVDSKIAQLNKAQ